jgi:excisionase family DNA binding protein
MMRNQAAASTDRAARAESARLVSPEEVAMFLGVPLRTVYRWRSRGDGPRAYRVGRHVRYRVEDVEAWLDEHRDAS